MPTDLKLRRLMRPSPGLTRRSTGLLASLAALLQPLTAHAAVGASPVASHLPLAIGWDWWLPPNYAVHGKSMDALFIVIFWITTVVFVGVQVVLVYFMVKYRHREGKKKAVFVHGNTRLEMIWTIIPAIILIGLAVATKGVWENYRYSPNRNDADRAQILVIGQQFNWNVVYPGPDGKLGRYLIFPKTTDLKWPQVPDGASFVFPHVPGPAYLPEAKARVVLNDYIGQVNPLGKDFSDPDGIDDDWLTANGRAVEIPKDRLVDINLGSKDVIHDFFLPNFRVKLDAVPGMKGHVYFTATASSKEFEDLTHKIYPIDELAKAMVGDEEWIVKIPPKTPQATHERQGARQWLFKDDDGTIVRDSGAITALPDPDLHKTAIQRLRDKGVTEIEAYRPKHWDLVCEELCGLGHYKMQDNLVVLEDDVYRAKYGPKLPQVPVAEVAPVNHEVAPIAATAPAVAAPVAATAPSVVVSVPTTAPTVIAAPPAAAPSTVQTTASAPPSTPVSAATVPVAVVSSPTSVPTTVPTIVAAPSVPVPTTVPMPSPLPATTSAPVPSPTTLPSATTSPAATAPAAH